MRYLQISRQQIKEKVNKTVLLCERKRHTARHLASTPSVVLIGGGVPHPRSRWGVPHPRSKRRVPRSRWEVPHPRSRQGVPHPRSRWGDPIPGGTKGTPCLDLARVPPTHPVMGHPPGV